MSAGGGDRPRSTTVTAARAASERARSRRNRPRRTSQAAGRRSDPTTHAAALVARSSMAATPHLRSYVHGSGTLPRSVDCRRGDELNSGPSQKKKTRVGPQAN
ncbi:hypothetical protein PVAP13_1NG328219 [Panicum virgatum]|uniref:Uncharacterized protein n=1 Tax=Panicum virgatum TaxID=38727 RepID=A0A8T0WSC4_PANVG|nr:hypothetical protein PVAP13_1NG328219 [Panicum virgatum]